MWAKLPVFENITYRILFSQVKYVPKLIHIDKLMNDTLNSLTIQMERRYVILLYTLRIEL